MSDDMIGRVISGRYKLIYELGRGSFASVYIALETEINAIYAMKIMHLELSNDGDLLARFQREAHILRNLDDPHIVKIVDYGSENSMMNFIVMDYIDGQTLKYHMQRVGQMDALQAITYAQEIAQGLDAAYRLGVVHRDIKPQNILLTSKGAVKIVDFGLARGRDTVTLTQSNVFMGTAYYIAPEQAESGRSADTRSDLYSVAALLFEMLAGHPPFQGDSAVDIVIKHMHDKIPSICRLRRDLPGEMDAFMQKALAKSPADRYATPHEFSAALEQVKERMLSRPPLGSVPGLDSGPPTPTATRPKQGRFVVISSGQTIPLTGELMVVGRQDPTLGIFPEITLADKTVGRRHAYVRNQQGDFSVEDLNALNKTRLNGVILTPHEERALKDGDILRFGSIEVRFELR